MSLADVGAACFEISFSGLCDLTGFDASRFNSDVDVTAHHGNIKDKQFGFSFMQQFDVVFNALDNVGTCLRRFSCL